MSILLQKSWNDESEIACNKKHVSTGWHPGIPVCKVKFSFLATPIYRIQLKDTEEQ